MHIAVAGNIGAGKTTLISLLSKKNNWEAHFEDVDNNPYLNDFYQDMKRWSFNLQIFFLHSRFQKVIEILNSNKTVIQDRTIYEDANIFAPNLHSMGLMTTRDYNNYKNLFNLMTGLIKPPDLLIYLRANVETLVTRIQKRGRDYEQAISVDYLTRLNERYEAWVAGYKDKILIVDVNDKNFEDRNDDLDMIIKQIKTNLK